jgi:hypothetical protein
MDVQVLLDRNQITLFSSYRVENETYCYVIQTYTSTSGSQFLFGGVPRKFWKLCVRHLFHNQELLVDWEYNYLSTNICSLRQ